MPLFHSFCDSDAFTCSTSAVLIPFLTFHLQFPIPLTHVFFNPNAFVFTFSVELLLLSRCLRLQSCIDSDAIACNPLQFRAFCSSLLQFRCLCMRFFCDSDTFCCITYAISDAFDGLHVYTSIPMPSFSFLCNSDAFAFFMQFRCLCMHSSCDSDTVRFVLVKFVIEITFSYFLSQSKFCCLLRVQICPILH